MSLETHRKGSTQPGKRKKGRRNVARGVRVVRARQQRYTGVSPRVKNVYSQYLHARKLRVRETPNGDGLKEKRLARCYSTKLGAAVRQSSCLVFATTC